MSILRKNKPVHPLHRQWTWRDEVKDFWLMNKPLIGILLVLACICILIYMLGLAAGTGHIHALSSDANRYEHMEEIVLYTGRFDYL